MALKDSPDRVYIDTNQAKAAKVILALLKVSASKIIFHDVKYFLYHLITCIIDCNLVRMDHPYFILEWLGGLRSGFFGHSLVSEIEWKFSKSQVLVNKVKNFPIQFSNFLKSFIYRLVVCETWFYSSVS